jgi:hypothetical protein
MTRREHPFAPLRCHSHLVVLAIVLAAGITFRVRAYGDPRLSVSTPDTDAFIRASQLPLLSWDFFTSNRPPTIALLYKLLEPRQGYEIANISDPAATGPVDKTLQPGLDRVVLAQMALSIFAWSSLAIAAARRLSHPLVRVLALSLILAFGFSPPLAEWDSVLMSESISFSLFALLLALTLEAAAALAGHGDRPTAGTRALLAAWLAALALWVFSRDSNAYVLPLTVVMIVAVLIPGKLRRHLPSRDLAAAALVVAGLFAFHNLTLYASDRWINPFLNNLIYNVLRDENRIRFFQDRGMPLTVEVLSFRDSRGNEAGFLALPYFMEWVRDRGATTYTLFLINHWHWAVSTVLHNLEALFSENMQPYFHLTPQNLPGWSEPWGNMLHISSSAPILLDPLLTLALVLVAMRRGSRGATICWSSIWLLLSEFVLLFVSYHGDSLGVIRHVLVAVVPLRLSTWILPLALLDTSLMAIPGATMPVPIQNSATEL